LPLIGIVRAIKGILLCGGNGTRLYPSTKVVPKSLQNVFDKPMIYYSLSTLMLAGITEIVIISSMAHLHMFEELLGNGHDLGLDITYMQQAKPQGIAQAIQIAANYIDEDNFALLLGDNLFYADDFAEILAVVRDQLRYHDAAIFGYPVANPTNYGVINTIKHMYGGGIKVSVIEKPIDPPSNYAVPGLYFFRPIAKDIAGKLKPSARGELEITDVINQAESSYYHLLSRGVAWYDTGTPSDLLDASNFIAAIEKRTGLKIGCIEEVAYRMGYITIEQLYNLMIDMPNGDYKTYLGEIILDGTKKAGGSI